MNKKNDESSSIKQIFPIEFQWPTLDPFLFCAYHKDDFPAGNPQFGPTTGLPGRSLGSDFQVKDGFRMYHGEKVPGFPAHPHRGFETVTIVNQGIVDHADSLGAAGRYGNGDVQWMTAGKGVQHSEMFPLLDQKQANPLELFQVWLNLPQASKFVDPHFAMFWNHHIPVFKMDSVSVKVVAGNLEKMSPLRPPPKSWASGNDNYVAIWVITLEPEKKWILPQSAPALTRCIYFYRGHSVSFGSTPLEVNHGLSVASDAALTLTNLHKTPASMLLLQGKPIAEPMVQHGPFVMNTKAEINQAIDDYRRTQFGGWPWPRNDMIHGREQKRFALFPNGKREEPV